MEFGIGVTSGVDAWRVVQRAESLGFSHAWFVDTQLLCADLFAAMAVAAVHTSRIRLGTGVLVPSNRIAPVTANGLATMNKLAPGRIDFGVGTGFTARNTMGLGAMRLTDLREHVRVVRGLLAGETVECELDGQRRKIRFLNPDAGLIDIGHRIPLHLSAFGPRARALTVEIADGWMHFVGRLTSGLRGVREMTEACRTAGRDPASLYKTAFAMGCVLAEGEAHDSPRARAQAGPFALTFYHSLMDGSLPMRVPAALATAVLEYRAMYEALRARRRALPAAPPRPLHVPAPRRRALPDRRPPPRHDLHRPRRRAARPDPRPARRRPRAVRRLPRPRPRGRHRGLGAPDREGLRV